MQPQTRWPSTDIHTLPARELMAGFVDEGSRLIRAELKIARAEFREEVRQAGRAGATLAAGGVLLHVGLLCVATMLIALLSLAMPVWIAALIVTVISIGVGAMLVSSGRRQLRSITPTATINEYEEDSRWIQQLTRDVRVQRHASA